MFRCLADVPAVFTAIVAFVVVAAAAPSSLALAMPSAPSTTHLSARASPTGCTAGDSATAASSTESPLPNKHKSNKWLVLDFDGTCTEHDTTPLLPRMASLHSGDDDARRKQRLEQFNALEQEYFDAYSAAKKRVLGNDSDGGDDTNMDLHEALESLDEVSTVVTHKVSQSSCLSGLPSHPRHMADLIDQHEELRRLTRLQNDCVAVVADAHLAGWCLGVLSINWCPNLIEAALVMPVRRHLDTRRPTSTPIIGNKEDRGVVGDKVHLRAEVWSNEIDDKGAVTLHVPGASAKRTCIQSLKEKLRIQQDLRDKESRRPIVIYIGDSSTDLSGLLEADIGIMLGASATIEGIAKRWNIELSKLSDRRRHVRQQKGGLLERDSDTIWMADGWKEIDSLLQDVSD
mmetsp:Transcript_34963/g.75765  ORF Transcript_34963/g.75765 Transcript_34963/m.75765 type:complete len:402 (-) Transcript_34963:1720-2925(-)